jgi:D-alanine-D-alanine ligase
MSGKADKVRVAVVFGGRSAEHAISCVSAGSVIAALDPDRYDVVRVGIATDGRWVLADPDQRLAITGGQLPEVTGGTAVSLVGDPAGRGLAVLDPGTAIGPALTEVDVVFPVLHGAYGEDGTIQGLLEMAGVPYVGSGVFASAASMDKEFTKKLLAANGLPQGDHVVLRDADGALCADPKLLDDAARDRLGLPVFVKPSRAGSSIGITKVTDWADLPEAVATAAAVDEKVIVEASVPGR